MCSRGIVSSIETSSHRHRPPHSIQFARIAVAFLVGGWMFGAFTTIDDGLKSALLGQTAINSAIAALLVSPICAVFMIVIRYRFIGMLIPSLVAPAAIYLHFTIWPVQSWEIDAYKATGIVLKSYWEYLLPISLTGGVIAMWWSRHPWQLFRSHFGTFDNSEEG